MKQEPKNCANFIAILGVYNCANGYAPGGCSHCVNFKSKEMKKRVFYVCLKCGRRFLSGSQFFKNNIKKGRHVRDNGKIEPLKDLWNRHDSVVAILALARKGNRC